MIWMLLCKLGRHDWQPVFRHHAVGGDVLRSLVRCNRVTYTGGVCAAERYRDSTSRDWKRGGQL